MQIIRTPVLGPRCEICSFQMQSYDELSQSFGIGSAKIQYHQIQIPGWVRAMTVRMPSSFSSIRGLFSNHYDANEG